MKQTMVERDSFRRMLFLIAFALGCATILVWSLAHAAGRKIPMVEVTGGRVAGHKFKADYEKTVADLHLVMTTSKEFRTVPWSEATKWFDFAKTLPVPTANELNYSLGTLNKRQVKTRYLPDVFEKLYSKQFSDPKYGLKTPPVPDEDWVRSFGDMMLYFKNLRGKAPETEKALETLKTKYPAIWSEVSDVIPQLVRNDYLYSEKWDPYQTSTVKGKDGDGILFFDYWKMQPNPARSALWNNNPEEHHVYQAGVFIYATLQDIKSHERNFKEYLEYVGMGNLEVAMIGNSYIRGTDDKGDEFMGMEVWNAGALPWPYNPAAYAMKMFDYYNAKGQYVCEYYSENRADLNYMAGRDTYLEVKDSKNQPVGWLISTELDFDIKGLPEGDKDRIITIRGNWGNIKLIVEGFKGLSKVSTGPGNWSK